MDNRHRGDKLLTSEQHEEELFTVLSANVNGLKTNLKGVTEEQFRHLETAHPSVVLLQEINAVTLQYDVKATIDHSLKKVYQGRVKQQYNTGKIKMSSHYKPGGTMAYVTHDHVGRVIEKGGDEFGRWSWIRLRGKGRIIRCVTVYQVCARPTNKTGRTAYHQQVSMFNSAGMSNTDPRKRFRVDLTNALESWTLAGDEIIIGGDFNEPFDSERSAIVKAMVSCDLIDPFHFLHRSDDFATYLYGSKPIDFMFVSSTLLDALVTAGYGKFGAYRLTDHRPSHLQFITKKLFGDDTHSIAPLSARGIHSKDHNNVTTYIEELWDHLTHNNAFKKMNKLPDNPNDSVAEGLDRVIIDGSRHAEKCCQRKHRNWFSVEINQLRVKESLLYRHKRNLRLKETHPFLDQLCKMVEDDAEELGLELTAPRTLGEVKTMIASTKKEIKQFEKEAFTKRQEFLRERADLLAETGETKAEKVLRSIMSVETQIEMWNEVNKTKDFQLKGAYNRLSIPHDWPSADNTNLNLLTDPKERAKQCKSLKCKPECEHWRTVDTPLEIQKYLLQRNKKHYGQAHGTPFTIPPLSVHFDWQGNSAEVELTLEGAYDNDEISDVSKLLLEHSNKSAEWEELPSSVTREEFCNRLLRWREGTSTSPTGIHLGHYKSLLGRSKYSKEHEETEYWDFQSKRDDLIDFHVQLLNYAVTQKYVYDRWKSIVTCVIEKEPGNPKIHRIRIIHIYEANYSLLMGIQWTRALRNAMEKKTLNQGLHGAVPGHESKTPVYMETL